MASGTVAFVVYVAVPVAVRYVPAIVAGSRSLVTKTAQHWPAISKWGDRAGKAAWDKYGSGQPGYHALWDKLRDWQKRIPADWPFPFEDDPCE